MEPYPRKKRLPPGDSFFHSFTFNSKFSRSNFENFSDGCPFFSGCIQWDVGGGVENYETVCFLHKFLYAFVFLLLNVHFHLQSDEFS